MIIILIAKFDTDHKDGPKQKNLKWLSLMCISVKLLLKY